MIRIRSSHLIRFGLAVVTAALFFVVAAPASAQKVVCSNEFRSGKLYFDQKIFDKSVAKFAVAVEHCPDKGEYRARYGLALCELGKEYIGKLAVATPDERDTLVAKGISFFDLAGQEFNAALETKDGQKKKLQKFVAQNRGHYWVHFYNEGLELYEEEDYEEAAMHFEIARMVNPVDTKAFSQGAIAMIRMERPEEALELIQAGLEMEPENERLLEIKTSIYHDTARKYANEADTQEDPSKVTKALELYDNLVEDDPEDPNLLFERGLTALTGAAVVSKADADQGKGLYARAGEDFRACAEMVPHDGPNKEFHENAIFNIVQAFYASGDAKAMEVNREYNCLVPLDPAGWQYLAGGLIEAELQDAAVSALMMSKSLAGSEVPVAIATGSASGDAQADLEAHGKPEHVFTYQETSSGNQIQTFIWLEKRQAVSYILGDKQGEVAWCGEAQ